jgi:broad specificity phosphatase PhoE
LIKIILVRHGETEWNKVHRLQGGSSDTPLNELGKQQAENLALRLKTEEIDAIYSSPLQRAWHTAQAIARYHGLSVNILSELKEMSVGELEGADSTTMKLRWDQLLCQDIDGEASRYGVELIGDVQERAWGAIRRLAQEYTRGSLVIVSHYVVIMSVVCAVLGLPLQQIVRLKLNPGTITTFLMNEDGTARLELFNDGCPASMELKN